MFIIAHTSQPNKPQHPGNFATDFAAPRAVAKPYLHVQRCPVEAPWQEQGDNLEPETDKLSFASARRCVLNMLCINFRLVLCMSVVHVVGLVPTCCLTMLSLLQERFFLVCSPPLSLSRMPGLIGDWRWQTEGHRKTDPCNHVPG